MKPWAPFIIHEASLTVYRALANGEPGEVWWTATAMESLDLTVRREFRSIWPTAAAVPRQRRLDLGRHSLDLSRIWRLPVSHPATPDLLDADDLVLDVLWTDQRYASVWHQRRYSQAVLLESGEAASVDQPFLERLRFEAGRVVQSGSSWSADQNPLGLTAAAQQVLFTREAPATNGALLAGVAAWSLPVDLTHAQLTWRPPVSGTTKIRCTINGSVNALEFTLPNGNPASVDTASIDLTGQLNPLAAGDTVTWQIVSAPAASGDCATQLSVVLTVQPL